MEWISALFKVLWEQTLFVLLIPVVLIAATLFLIPFEWVMEKSMKKYDDNSGNKLLRTCFGVTGIAAILTPVILVFLYG